MRENEGVRQPKVWEREWVVSKESDRERERKIDKCGGKDKYKCK